MPRGIKVYTGLEFFEGMPFWLMDRPAGPDEAVLGSADISATYDLKVYDVSTIGQPTLVHSETTGNLTRKASLTLGGTGGDPLWTIDDVGFTMYLEVLPAVWTVFPGIPGKTYLIVLTYTSAAWGAVYLLWRGACKSLHALGTLVA